MEKDTNRDMSLEQREVEDLIADIFKIGVSQKRDLAALLLSGEQYTTYEPFLQFIVPFYFC